MKLSLAKRFGLLFLLLALIVLADNALVYRYFESTEFYGPFIDLASRQQFLSREIELRLELVSRGDTIVDRPLAEAASTFDEQLRIFEEGGIAGGHEMPPAPQNVSSAVASLRERWDVLRPLLLQISEISAGEPVPDALLASARAETRGLVTSSVELVEGLEQWRARLVERVLYLGGASAAVVIVTLLLALRAVWTDILAPLERVVSQTIRVRETDLPAEEAEDLRRIADVVTEMSTDVERLRSERQEVEEELRQVEADYHAVFTNSVAGIFQYDARGQLFLANPAMARILGYESPTELLRTVQNVHEQLYVDARHHEKVLKALGRDEFHEMETPVRKKDGTVIWVLEGITSVGSADDPVFYDGVLIDVTPRKKAQESLRELSGLLLESQEAERRRIGRELHDSTGQLLAALEMGLARLGRKSQGLEPSVRETLSMCVDLAAKCSREIRSTSHLLHPPLLEELGLVYALRDYLEGFKQRSGIETEAEIDSGFQRLSPEAETALFRVAQEALTNVHRHARSPVARLRLTESEGLARLEVEDRGRGMTPRERGDGSSPPRLGVGIRGMQERLVQLGGRLKIETLDKGTRITAELPLESNRPSETAASEIGSSQT